MEFNEDLGMYTMECQGLTFAWEEEPEEDVTDEVAEYAENYHAHLDGIAEFIRPDIKAMYGCDDIEEIKVKLGKPVINYYDGQVLFTDHKFDQIHLFTLEFLDDAFEDLQYFSIDG